MYLKILWIFKRVRPTNMDLLCRNLLVYAGITITFCLDFVYSDADKYSDRVPDKPFPVPIMIHGKNVTCVDKNEHKPGFYAAQTWTCKNMTVDGHRMAYGYNPSMTKDNKCGETEGLDELAEVCREMMRKIGAKKELWAAFVTNATCNYINEKRYMLKFARQGSFVWHPMREGYGWIDTLRCMAVP